MKSNDVQYMLSTSAEDVLKVEKEPRKIRNVYEYIEKSRKRYGKLRKCEFHLHTPASHDYTLYSKYNDIKYKELKTSDIIFHAVEEGLISKKVADEMIENIEYYQSEEYVQVLQVNQKPFDDFKEYFVYMMIVHRLIKEEIEVVVVSDHNTIRGYCKLRAALKDYYERFSSLIKEKHLHLILGVEISCSELNHVIGIFDCKKIGVLENYLNEILMNEEGTYLSSSQVIDDISRFGGMAYLAHVDNSKLNGSLVYNTKLFSGENLNILGFHKIDESTKLIRERITHYNKAAMHKFCCIAEGDAHDLDNIGKRSVWIKFGRINYTTLQKAFKNHHICVYCNKPERSDKFIKGIVVEPGEHGFLMASSNQAETRDKKDIKDFVISFSRDLNCIIGGRGTGKSTILNAIETILTLQYNDNKTLRFLSKHNSIYIVFYCEGKDYILHFIPQRAPLYNENSEVTFLSKAFNGKELTKNWIDLYRYNKDEFERVEYNEAIEILQTKLYRRGYSINNLVSQINSDSIGTFIRDTVMYGEKYYRLQEYKDEIQSLYWRSYKGYLKKNLSMIQQLYQLQKEEIKKRTKSYNEKQKDRIKIEYSPNLVDVEDYLNDLLEKIGTWERKEDQYVAKTVVTWSNVEYFMQSACKKMGMVVFLDKLLNNKYEEIEKVVSLGEHIENPNISSYAHVEMGLAAYTEKNRKSVYKAIYDKTINCRNELIKGLERWLDLSDEFTLYFNVNHKETVAPVPPVFKRINELSLGQKVVAILTFVFTYGEHVGDNTPLIIDQPEDNLDNQYIFKNLVEALKVIKNKRQVIVVTHSSTIVTNADAEQVIVMESDNKNGWVLANGYPSETSMVKHIINYLEGGLPSFKNKAEMYGLMISSLAN